MSKKLVLAGAVSALAVSVAWAQEEEQKAVDLGEAPVVEQKEGSDAGPAKLYESFDPVDTGKTTIGSSSVNAQERGGTDTSELLVTIPGVQLNIDRRDVDGRQIQNIRPGDFTISGGNYYNNNIRVDGVGVNSVMDVSNGNPSHFNEVAGATAQTLYVDPSLIGEISVLDSNVSAEYGDFTGGVVEFTTRSPKDKFGFSIKTEIQTDDLVNYDYDNEFDGGDVSRPSFTKDRVSLTTDLPINDRARILLGYTRATSSVDFEKAESYNGITYDNGDKSENFLFSGEYDFSDTLRGRAKIVYSPYESEFENENRIEDLRITNSDGLAAQVGLAGEHHGFDWEGKIAFTKNDASRDWFGRNHFSWDADAKFVNWCNRSSCSQGGFGDIDQTQEDVTLDFKASKELYEGLFRFGGELRTTEVNKTRPEDNYAYSRGDTVGDGDFTTLACPAGDEACREDDIVLLQRSLYQKYDISVDVSKQVLWAEYEKDFNKLTLRGGLRYSHDDFLDNHDWAPRLTATYEVKPGTNVTVGANRYYAKNMVGYAVRSQYPDSFIFRRTYDVNAAGHATVNDWTLFRHTRSRDFSQGNLKTPYSDELTAAFTTSTPLDGSFRLKGVYREGKDRFAASPSERVPFDPPTATSSTTRRVTVTNDGESKYKGISAEWSGSYKNHAFGTSVTWSDTEVNTPRDTRSLYGNGDYFTEVDQAELEELVYYNGELITLLELLEKSQAANFATPLLANANLSSRWFEGKLRTNVLATYKGEFKSIDDTRRNITVDGTRYDIYDIIERGNTVRVNLNVAYDVMDNENGKATLEARVNNLFSEVDDTLTSRTNPYREGRSIWLGLKYTY